MGLTHGLGQPYQRGQIIVDGRVAVTLFKVHASVQKEYDLDYTYLCEIDFDRLKHGLDIFCAYSKYQASYRYLSVVIPKSLSFAELRAVIQEAQSAEVVRFYPVDTYESEELGDQMSLTLRFMLQSQEKTLEEEDITSSMDSILMALNDKLGISLR